MSEAEGVNGYFQRFYPDDACSNWQMEHCVQGYERRYLGQAKTIFPMICCADGFAMSAQGHFGAYSTPRGDFEPRYSAVEVCVQQPHQDALLDSHGRKENYKEFVIYPYVPVELVERVIEAHGGLAP